MRTIEAYLIFRAAHVLFEYQNLNRVNFVAYVGWPHPNHAKQQFKNFGHQLRSIKILLDAYEERPKMQLLEKNWK